MSLSWESYDEWRSGSLDQSSVLIVTDILCTIHTKWNQKICRDSGLVSQDY